MEKIEKSGLEIQRKERLHLRLTEQEHMEIKTYAAEHNLTITQILVSGFYALKNSEQEADK